MGLDITALTYYGDITWSDKFGSYGTLHRLRDWVFVEILNKDKSSDKHSYYDSEYGDYEALLNHSDADGYYLSFSEFKVKTVEDVTWCGNLDKLREEMKSLAEYREKMPEEVQWVYDRLLEVVNNKDKHDENEPVILVFR